MMGDLFADQLTPQRVQCGWHKGLITIDLCQANGVTVFYTDGTIGSAVVKAADHNAVSLTTEKSRARYHKLARLQNHLQRHRELQIQRRERQLL